MSNRTHGIEEYLEALFKLERGDEPVTVKHLAEELGVAPPSVSEMLGRMRAAGLVEAPGEAGVKLTPEGELEGARLVRRHRLSERFLVDYLGMPWDEVHDEACKFEHVLSPEVEARLAEQLGDPRTCPHGHAIPQADGSLAEEELSRSRASRSASPASSVASPRRAATSCATSPLWACCRTPRSKWRASHRLAVPCSCAWPGPSTRSGARSRGRSS